MLIGYARFAATDDDSTAKQVGVLLGAGCERIFTDEGVSGTAKNRPQLEQALAAVRNGDALVVWKLDRLASSLPHLVRLIGDLGKRGVGFRSLAESIDTTGQNGMLQLQLLAALASFERSLIAERTHAGLVAAKRRGAKLGRKPKLSPDQIAHARKLIDAGESPVQVARLVGVSTATLYRAIPAAASNRNTPDLFATASA